VKAATYLLARRLQSCRPLVVRVLQRRLLCRLLRLRGLLRLQLRRLRLLPRRRRCRLRATVCCRLRGRRLIVAAAEAEGVHEVLRRSLAAIDVHLLGVELVKAATYLLARRLQSCRPLVVRVLQRRLLCRLLRLRGLLRLQLRRLRLLPRRRRRRLVTLRRWLRGRRLLRGSGCLDRRLDLLYLFLGRRSLEPLALLEELLKEVGALGRLGGRLESELCEESKILDGVLDLGRLGLRRHRAACLLPLLGLADAEHLVIVPLL